jgi:CRP/FNR family cyclic AMP-dependent transcriptional regulator
METKLLKNIPLFNGLAKPELKAILSNALIRHYPKNAIIINEGDNTDSLYVVLEGKVKAYLSDDAGREIILSIQGPGDYIGELAIIDEQPRSASVMTLEPCKFCIISKSYFDSCLVNNPTIAIKLLKTQTLRVRRLTENVKSLALLDVYGRVARTLLNMATPHKNELIIDQKLTHMDIAKMVGASREMVSRIMKDLSEGGYIKSEDRRITINERLPDAW